MPLADTFVLNKLLVEFTLQDESRIEL